MTFNETNVNRDQSGKFDTKTGAPAETTLSTSAADDKYTAAYEAYWEKAVPAYDAAREEAQDMQLELVRADIALVNPNIAAAEVVWDDEMEALGRPSRFYDADGNEVDLGVETDNTLDLFDDYDALHRNPDFAEMPNGFRFAVSTGEISEDEHDTIYNNFWGNAMDKKSSAEAVVQERQLDLVRAEIGLEDQNIVSAEVEWDSEWGALGRPSRFYNADGEEIDLGVETDTSLDAFGDFDEVRRDPNFALEGETFRFTIRPE